MTTVHVIFNAHIDPVWLWPWPAGVDEALATCRSACDRLDANPDIHFTRGEAWIHQQIEQLDPDLFARIRQHVEAGRWELVGGWWIQPDCNAPSGFALERQIRLGLDYFRDTFGIAPRTGYNVDSFGHAAALPGLMRAAGQDRYIMMRPQHHEMSLPARLFRWRGHAGGPEVLAFRISQAYCHRTLTAETVRAACSRLPEGIHDTLLFAGVGDHGGGPSEKLIAWCRANRDAIPGCRIVFSTVGRFFDTVSADLDKIPLVTGELQHHAIGCYSVHRAIKTKLRKSEHLLAQAETALAAMPEVPGAVHALAGAWQDVCFNQFHDTLGGSCIPSAYPACERQVDGAGAVAEGLLQRALRLRYPALGRDPLQRIVLLNASDAPFDGHAEFEPWLDGRTEGFSLIDEQGRPVPWQRLQHEAGFVASPRVLFRIAVQPGGLRQLRLAPVQEQPGPSRPALAEGMGIRSGTVSCDGRTLRFGDASPLEPLFDLIEDGTDTWSHGVDRYPEGPVVASAGWNHPCVPDSGPLMAAALLEGAVGGSRMEAEWRVYADEAFAELRLRVHWTERRKLLKLRLAFPAMATDVRTDGGLGGQVARPNNGRELPLRDWTLVTLSDGRKLGVVAPDVFGLDADTRRLRLTLLRSCIMAHHEPHRGHFPRQTYSDPGVHEFRFRFFLSEAVDADTLERHALMMQRPLVCGDLTHGMPTHRE